jgi:hypothetical protein
MAVDDKRGSNDSEPPNGDDILSPVQVVVFRRHMVDLCRDDNADLNQYGICKIICKVLGL